MNVNSLQVAIKLINKIPEPTEHEMQCALFAILKVYEERVPEWQAIYAIPNGAKLPYGKNSKGKRFSKEASWLLKEGMKPGTPDICCPFGIGKHLYIELKKPGNKPSLIQNKRIELLKSVGNIVLICTSVAEAMEKIIFHTSIIYKAYADIVFNNPTHPHTKTFNLLMQISKHKY